MLPIVDELYDTDDQRLRHFLPVTFFNTEPQIGSMVGLTASLEEARANSEAIDDETISLRAGLMGPLAGLGDSISLVLYSILLGIALEKALSKGGSVLGPLFYVVVWNLIMYFGMKFA